MAAYRSRLLCQLVPGSEVLLAPTRHGMMSRKQLVGVGCIWWMRCTMSGVQQLIFLSKYF